MDRTLEKIFESPENLEYLAKQSRLLSMSPRKYLAELGVFPSSADSGDAPDAIGASAWQEHLSELLARLQSNQGPPTETQGAADSSESAYDVALRLGLIGAAKNTPSDLSTNPEYLKGFGE